MASVKKRFSICAGKKYQKGTEEKTQWIKVGQMVVWDDGGISQQIDCLPTGTWWDGKLSVFEEKQEGTQTTQQTAVVATPQPTASDLPF